MRKLFIQACLFLLITTKGIVVFAQESKNINIKGFSTLSVSSGIDVYLNQSQSESLTLKGNATVIKNVIVEQNGDDLTIKMKPNTGITNMFNNLSKSESIKVYLNFKTLNELKASGGSDIISEKNIKADKFSIQASGGSDIKLDLNCKNLMISSSGGSDVNLKGNADNLVIQSSGGSDVNAYQLIADYAKVASSGGSDVYITVNKGLDASATGGSDIHYKGNAALKNNSNSKSGSVKRVN